MKNIGRSAAVAVILGLSIGATHAATVNISGSGFFGPNIETTAESAPGQTFTFSFITPNPVSSDVDTTLIDPTFALAGHAIAPSIKSVTFHDANDNGLFDLLFEDNTKLSFYGADIDDNGILQPGFYFAQVALGEGDPTAIGAVSVSVNVSPVPLPASAPLFGAALLGLGVTGYGMRRTMKIDAKN